MRRVAFFRVRLDAGEEADKRALNAFIDGVQIRKIVPALVQTTAPSFWSVYVEYEDAKEPGATPLSGNEPVGRRAARLQRIRQLYQRAYEKWTDAEDDSLRVEYGKGVDVETLSKMFQRQPGAISARLYRLGLIEWRPTSTAPAQPSQHTPA